MGNKQSKPSTVTATYIRYVTLTEHHTRTEFSTATTTDTTTITTTSTTTTYRDVPERYQTDVNLFISFLDSLPTLLFVSIGLVLIGYTVYGIFKVADKVWQSYLARDKRGVRGNIVGAPRTSY